MRSFRKSTTRVWPTLLAAASQAANRAKLRSNKRGAEVHTSIIMARTAFDAYLHELVSLRELEPFVQFSSGHHGRRKLSQRSWRMIEDRRISLREVPKEQRHSYKDVRHLDLEEKLQSILMLLNEGIQSDLVSAFERQFQNIVLLNNLRNAIVHHNFKAPTSHLVSVCDRVRLAAGAVPAEEHLPWEDIFAHHEVAIWASRTVAFAIIAVENADRNRRIHLSATRDTVLSAMSPLELL